MQNYLDQNAQILCNMFMNGFSLYLERTGQSIDGFAGLIKKPRETVRRWANGESRPNRSNMPEIKRVTNNQVTADDFFTEGAR